MPVGTSRCTRLFAFSEIIQKQKWWASAAAWWIFVSGENRQVPPMPAPACFTQVFLPKTVKFGESSPPLMWETGGHSTVMLVQQAMPLEQAM